MQHARVTHRFLRARVPCARRAHCPFELGRGEPPRRVLPRVRATPDAPGRRRQRGALFWVSPAPFLSLLRAMLDVVVGHGIPPAKLRLGPSAPPLPPVSTPVLVTSTTSLDSVHNDEGTFESLRASITSASRGAPEPARQLGGQAAYRPRRPGHPQHAQSARRPWGGPGPRQPRKACATAAYAMATTSSSPPLFRRVVRWGSSRRTGSTGTGPRAGRSTWRCSLTMVRASSGPPLHLPAPAGEGGDRTPPPSPQGALGEEMRLGARDQPFEGDGATGTRAGTSRSRWLQTWPCCPGYMCSPLPGPHVGPATLQTTPRVGPPRTSIGRQLRRRN